MDEMQQDESVVTNRKNPPVQTAAPLNPHSIKPVACLVGSGCMFMLHGLLHICHFRTEPGRNRPMLYPNKYVDLHSVAIDLISYNIYLTNVFISPFTYKVIDLHFFNQCETYNRHLLHNNVVWIV